MTTDLKLYQEHPVRKWLELHEHEEKIWPNLQALLPLLQTEPLKGYYHIVIKNEVIQYFNHVLEHNDYWKGREENLFAIYEQFMQEDNKKKSLVWNAHTLYALDQHEAGKTLLKNHGVDLSSNCPQVRKLALEETLHDLKNNWKSSNFRYEKQFETLLNTAQTKVERYGYNIEWHKILNNFPVLPMGIIAQKQGYDIIERELVAIFNDLFVTGRNNFGNFAQTHYFIEVFCDMFSQTKAFKNTLAPTKNMPLAICRFFGQKLPNNDYNDNSFIDQVMTEILHYEAFRYENMAKKLDQQRNIKVTGKAFINPEEKKMVEAHYKTKDQPRKKMKV